MLRREEMVLRKRLKVVFVSAMFAVVACIAAIIVDANNDAICDRMFAVRNMPVIEAEGASLTSIALHDSADLAKMRSMKADWAVIRMLASGQSSAGSANDLLMTSDGIGVAQYYDGERRMRECVFFLPYDAEEIKLKRIGSPVFRDYAEYLRDGYFLMPDAHLVKTEIMADAEELHERNPQDDGVLVFLKWEDKSHGGIVESDWEKVREIGELRLQCLEEGIDVTEPAFMAPYSERLDLSHCAVLCSMALLAVAGVGFIVYGCYICKKLQGDMIMD